MRTIIVECLLRQIIVAFDTLSSIISNGGIGGGSGVIIVQNGYAITNVGGQNYQWPVAPSLVDTGSNVITVTDGIAYFSYLGNNYQFPVAPSP
jgi:hypothetical protein